MTDVQALLVRFGGRLREERLRKLLNQEDFAALAGLKKNSQVLYESGKSAPTIEYLYRLASQGIDVDYIFTGRRANGSGSAMDTIVLNMLAQLSAREREAVMQLLMTLSGNVVDLASIRQNAEDGRDANNAGG